MIFAAVSDAVWLGLFAFLQVMGLAGIAAYMEWSRRKTEAASKVVEVKVDEVKDVAHKIHKLTDGNMGEQLKIGMIAAQTLASTTPSEANTQLSKAATEKYESHLAGEALTAKGQHG